MGLTRQEYSGNLPNPRIKPRYPALQADSLPTELWGKPSLWGLQNSLSFQNLSYSYFLFESHPQRINKKPRLWHVKYLLISHSVQLLSCIWLFMTPWTTAHQASLSITNSRSLLKLMSIESVMTTNPLILCCPLLLLPSIFPNIRVFSIESVLLIRWPKYWSFSFSISPSNEYSGLNSFRMDWFDLLAVQGTLKSLLYSSNASILWCSAFFIVQLSHPYMTTGKTIALTRRTFVGKAMSVF